MFSIVARTVTTDVHVQRNKITFYWKHCWSFNSFIFFQNIINNFKSERNVLKCYWWTNVLIRISFLFSFIGHLPISIIWYWISIRNTKIVYQILSVKHNQKLNKWYYYCWYYSSHRKNYFLFFFVYFIRNEFISITHRIVTLISNLLLDFGFLIIISLHGKTYKSKNKINSKFD